MSDRTSAGGPNEIVELNPHLGGSSAGGSIGGGPTVATSRDEAVRAFHRRLPRYASTPLVEAPWLAAELGVGRVLVKDESTRLGLPSFKMLGASWATYAALVERFGPLEGWETVPELAELLPRHDLVLVAATDGNHGRAVARMASLLRLSARILVPEGLAAARVDAIAGEGARVEVVDGTYDDAVARSAEIGAVDPAHVITVSDTSWPGYESIPQRVIEGYGTIFAEIDEALSGTAIDICVVPVGVGALAAAAVRNLRAAGGQSARARIVSVEPLDAACVQASLRAGRIAEVPGPHRSIMAGLNCGLPSLVAFPDLLRGIDVAAAVGDEAARRAMADLAAIGVPAGECGAASLAGARAALRDPETRGALGAGPATTLLLLSTEGVTGRRS